MSIAIRHANHAQVRPRRAHSLCSTRIPPRPQRLCKMRRSAKLLMIAADKVHHPAAAPVPAAARPHRSRIDLAAIEQVPGKEDDVPGSIAATIAAIRRANASPLMLPRCRSLTSSACRPRQLSGRPGNRTATRRSRIFRAFTRPYAADAIAATRSTAGNIGSCRQFALPPEQQSAAPDPRAMQSRAHEEEIRQPHPECGQPVEGSDQWIGKAKARPGKQ